MHKAFAILGMVSALAFAQDVEVELDVTEAAPKKVIERKDTVYVMEKAQNKKAHKKAQKKQKNYWDVTSKKYKRYIGITGDVALSPGISMKRWGQKRGIVLNILPFYFEENYDSTGSSDDWDYNERYNGYDKTGVLMAGGAFLNKLNEGRMHRFYNYIGGHYYSFYESADYYEDRYSSVNNHVKEYSWTHEAGLSAGVGIEVWSKKLAIDFRTGLVGTYEFTEESKKILPSIGVGFYYRYDRKK